MLLRRDKAESKETGKTLDQYRQDKPPQLTLFELTLPENRQHSNTVQLYDFMPKYHYGKAQRINGKFLDQLEREFECEGRRYHLQIKPASIVDKDGIEKYYYPRSARNWSKMLCGNSFAKGRGCSWTTRPAWPSACTSCRRN